MDTGADAYRTIGEVAEQLKLPQHVLRFWESRFPQVKPLKRAGGRRSYHPDDVALLGAIKDLLYGEGYTIKGVQRLLQDQGAHAFAAEPSPIGDRRPSFQARAPDQPASFAPAPSASAADRSAAVARLAAACSDLAECARILRSVRGDGA